MFIPLSELVFVPVDSVSRISFFGGDARVELKPNSSRGDEVVVVKDEDARRLFSFIMAQMPSSHYYATMEEAAKSGVAGGESHPYRKPTA
jgi:hypothetical protein